MYQLMMYMADEDTIQSAGGTRSMSIAQARAQGIVGAAGTVKPQAPPGKPAAGRAPPKPGTHPAVPPATAGKGVAASHPAGGATPGQRTVRKVIGRLFPPK